MFCFVFPQYHTDFEYYREITLISSAIDGMFKKEVWKCKSRGAINIFFQIVFLDTKGSLLPMSLLILSAPSPSSFFLEWKYSGPLLSPRLQFLFLSKYLNTNCNMLPPVLSRKPPGKKKKKTSSSFTIYHPFKTLWNRVLILIGLIFQITYHSNARTQAVIRK